MSQLTELDVFVLAALERLGPQAYGVLIREDILERTGRSVSIGSLYKAMQRLERQGLVEFSTGAPTGERGGRAKKHVIIQPGGRAALREATAAMVRMVEGLDLNTDRP